jgi:4-oxalocrotonate tautomerase family enzyme
MPNISVDLPRSSADSVLVAIHQSIKLAVHEHLATKDPKFDYVNIREVVGPIGNGTPMVAVDLRPGRSAERKRAFVDAVSRILKEQLEISREDICVVFRETDGSNYFCGGEPISAYVAPEFR